MEKAVKQQLILVNRLYDKSKRKNATKADFKALDCAIIDMVGNFDSNFEQVVKYYAKNIDKKNCKLFARIVHQYEFPTYFNNKSISLYQNIDLAENVSLNNKQIKNSKWNDFVNEIEKRAEKEIGHKKQIVSALINMERSSSETVVDSLARKYLLAIGHIQPKHLKSIDFSNYRSKNEITQIREDLIIQYFCGKAGKVKIDQVFEDKRSQKEENDEFIINARNSYFDLFHILSSLKNSTDEVIGDIKNYKIGEFESYNSNIGRNNGLRTKGNEVVDTFESLKCHRVRRVFIKKGF